ncbi:tail protein X [Pseudomonas weihenstephanensis]|uniref:tail protein X n=1 Tax=Pseudomonas weihenstephanensis TaxID=1608994 RepID=UPI0009E225C2|nr:tail protein X [Pseudomonas weihenstephanensis]GLX90623.1 hypothetical protein Pfra02_31910 [Pseudomonas fragi]
MPSEVNGVQSERPLGQLNGTVEAVLDANQGLADEVQPFKAGLVIHLPDLTASSDEVVMLWA